jgi:hypothetical protein
MAPPKDVVNLHATSCASTRSEYIRTTAFGPSAQGCTRLAGFSLPSASAVLHRKKTVSMAGTASSPTALARVAIYT